MVTIGLPISYILLGLNFIAIILLRWKKLYNRKVFFALYAADVILAGVIMVVGLGGIGESNSCANNKVMHRYAGFQSMITIVVSVMAIFGPFDWVIRYANAPGNLVWPFLFFPFQWTNAFKGSYITVGVITLLITLTTFVVHALTIRGTTAKNIKIIRIQWIVALVLMAICQIIVFVTYLAGADANTFNDMIAKKLAQTYLPINIIDAIFWFWGLMTLNMTGDVVKDNIMKH